MVRKYIITKTVVNGCEVTTDVMRNTESKEHSIKFATYTDAITTIGKDVAKKADEELECSFANLTITQFTINGKNNSILQYTIIAV